MARASLFLYYGNASASDQQQRTAVWDRNHKGVWHLPNGTVPDYGLLAGKTDWYYGYGLFSQTSAVRFFVNTYSNNVASAALMSGTWYHVAATYDGAAMKLEPAVESPPLARSA